MPGNLVKNLIIPTSVNVLPEKTPIGTDVGLLEDSENNFTRKKFLFSEMLGGIADGIITGSVLRWTGTKWEEYNALNLQSGTIQFGRNGLSPGVQFHDVNNVFFAGFFGSIKTLQIGTGSVQAKVRFHRTSNSGTSIFAGLGKGRLRIARDGESDTDYTPPVDNNDVAPKKYVDDQINDFDNIDFSALQNFADDTAAATGGRLIGQLYRTGSIVKVRVT